MLESVSSEQANVLEKRQKELRKISIARAEATGDSMRKRIHRNCALRDNYPYRCVRNKQNEDSELLRYSTCRTGGWGLADASGKWPRSMG